MSKVFLKTLFLLFLLWDQSITVTAQGSKPAFWDDIQSFKKKDGLQPPPKNAILFVGSSSFTNWKDVQEYFPGYTIINRGFGGSTLSDQVRYVNDIVFPYQPKQIVIYCGENDLAASDTITAEIVFERFKQLFIDIRTRLPRIPVIYISMKPSPSRWNLKDKMITANDLIRKYLKKHKKTVFINIWNDMLGPDGKPLRDLFVDDQLHMNAKGYAIWQKALKPSLMPDHKR
jgi:lysophospholipase L1-like esterase